MHTPTQRSRTDFAFLGLANPKRLASETWNHFNATEVVGAFHH